MKHGTDRPADPQPDDGPAAAPAWLRAGALGLGGVAALAGGLATPPPAAAQIQDPVIRLPPNEGGEADGTDDLAEPGGPTEEDLPDPSTPEVAPAPPPPAPSPAPIDEGVPDPAPVPVPAPAPEIGEQPAPLPPAAFQPRHGWLGPMAVAETPMGLDEWTFTGFVRRAAGGVEVLSPQAALGDATAASTTIAAPRIRLRIDEPLPEARTAQQRRCDLDPETIGPQIRRAWAMVGELNNAYNDGTTARFTYGEDHVTETHFGVVTPVPGGPPGSIEIEGENTISERGRVGFPAARRRFSRRLYSFFEFERIKKRMTRCSAWDTYIKARQWIGGGDERRQRGMLDRCIPEALGDFDGGAEFHRASGKAVRWRRGVEIWGIHLTTRSGFSTHVQTHQYFGGLRRKAHYLCGKDGVGSPYSAGRIASGARTIRPTVHNPGR